MKEILDNSYVEDGDALTAEAMPTEQIPSLSAMDVATPRQVGDATFYTPRVRVTPFVLGNGEARRAALKAIIDNNQ